MRSWLRVMRSWRVWVAMLYGFSSGLPLSLTSSTLQAWLTAENFSISAIGLFSLVGLPYTWKFLWSPIMDRYVPPFLGRRRGWLLVTQIALVAGILGMALINPAVSPRAIAVLALLVAFFSASQDIVVDGHRTDLLPPDEVGPGVSLYVVAYRVAAQLIGGSLALILAQHLPWRVVYVLMAAFMSVGIFTTLLSPEPETHAKPPVSLKDAVVLPFVEFFKRRGAIEILIFIIIYKLDVAFTLALNTTFLMKVGFNLVTIGAWRNTVGLLAAILGGLVSGALMIRLGLLRSLVIFGAVQAICGLSFTYLAHLGQVNTQPDHWMLVVMVGAIAAENFFSSMGNVAYMAFMMALCNRSFTVTQYALFSSLMALARVVLAAPTGYLVQAAGWENYFILCTLIGVPGLLQLLRYRTWVRNGAVPGAPEFVANAAGAVPATG